MKPILTNKVEDKIIRLCVSAFDGFKITTDYMVYNMINSISGAVMSLHYLDGTDMELVTSIVIDKLEKKGVEICY
jgi:hypothetical protein